MKLNRFFWARMVPVIVLVFVTMVLSVTIYNKMVSLEEESCWERLEIATKSTAEKIKVRITDNINFLEAVSDSFVLKYNLDDEKEVGEYLTSVMEMTIFERIDVLLPSGGLLTQSGEILEQNSEFSYEELLLKGKHISTRKTSPFSGKEVIYCFTPIERDGEVLALLIGTIDCETMGNLFRVFTYGENAQMFLVDCEDGNYLIDNWHDTLGNIQDLGERLSLDGMEALDMAPAILAGESTRMFFVSKSNGENSYQYCAPVEEFHWELCVTVQEDVVFAQMYKMRRVLTLVGLVEIFWMVFFVAWNAWVSLSGAKSEARANKLEGERAQNEARAKFISNMSHDVRTPLNGIVGMLHIIKTHREDEQLVDDCLRKIEVSTQYLSTLASDMLDINEIENNKLILTNDPIDLRVMADELDVMIELKAKDAGVTYHVDYSRLKDPYVIGSAVHIKRILVNLIGNAIKYSKDVGKNVWFSIEQEDLDAERKLYHFIVKDNGIGMTAEFQQNMYNAFEQERVTARSDYQGYGLGLTIVRHLVKRMKGSISLDSKKGKGSTFTVSLPLLLDKQEINAESNASESAQISGMRILLVEDNELNMEIAEMLLTDAGAVVTTAVNGRIATEVFAEAEENAFDVILMDIMMPELDGCEATKVIRKMEREDAKAIPIIAMTASTFADEVNRCKEAGMNAHIAKPLNVEILMSQIGKYYKQMIQSSEGN